MSQPVGRLFASPRLRRFMDSVGAGVVSWVVVWLVSAVGALVIGLFAAVTHGLSRWEQAGIVGLFGLLLLALAILVYLGVKAVKSPGAPAAPGLAAEPQPPERLLREKALQLGRDLFAFLREKGPEPKPEVHEAMTDTEIIQAGLEARTPYVEAVHYGYQHRFRRRTVELFEELAEHGIRDVEIQQWEIDPPQIQNAERVRKVAQHLFLIAARMDIAEQEKGI
jgi:hypothetical protein